MSSTKAPLLASCALAMACGTSPTSQTQLPPAISSTGVGGVLHVIGPPVIGSEIAVDNAVDGTTGMPASAPAIAFDGTNYFAVWADARADNQTDIWGTRISQTGVILDPAGIQIYAAPGVQANPTIAFDGSKFVVAWQDTAVGSMQADIGAATVSTAGVVSVLPPVATTASNDTNPALASTGAGALLVWVADGHLQGATFSGSFGSPFAITSSTSDRNPELAASPAGRYLVVYTETSATTKDDVRGQLIAAAGALVGGPFAIAAGPSPEHDPSATFDGANFDVVWTSNYPGVDVYGSRVTTAGSVLDTHAENGLAVGGKLIGQASNYQEMPAIACTASQCLVSWQDKRDLATTGYDLYGRVVTTALAPVGGELLISNARLHQTQPRVVTSGSGFFELWQDQRAGNNMAMRIVGARVTTGGSVLDGAGFVVNTMRNQEFAPSLAFASSHLSVTWSDSRSLWGNDIEMVRVAANGTVSDPQARAVSNAAFGQVAPAVIPFSSYLLYAWSDARTEPNQYIYVARANPATGAVVDPAGILVSQTTRANVTPQLATSGNEALVVWEDGTFDTSATQDDIWGAIISPSGSVTAPFVISNAATDQGRPTVAYDSVHGQYVVVWADARNGQQDIFGARVTPSGTVLDPAGVQLATSPGSDRFGVKIAVSGSTLFVTYVDRRAGNSDVYGSRITAGTALTSLDLGGIALTSDPGEQILPTVTALHGDFMVVWSDAGGAPAMKHDIIGRRVSAQGQMIDSQFVVSSQLEDETAPAVAVVGSNAVAVSYIKQLVTGRRVMVRMITSHTCGCDDECEDDFRSTALSDPR